MNRFENKTAFVTGAAGVLGTSLAVRFASEGAAVALADLPGTDLEAVASDVAEAGGRALIVRVDVTEAGDLFQGLQATVDAFGGLDVMVNNAGLEGGFANVAEYDDEMFDRTFAVNVRGVYLGMKHTVPLLRARGGGAIVNVASVAGLQGTPGMIAYGMSKHAVIGMTKTVAAEEAAAGIRVTAVCPAPVEGRMMRSIERGVSPVDGDGDSVRRAYRETIPVHRYAEPEEVSNLVTFLASDEARYITGSWHRVDGGMGVMSV